MVWFKVCLWAFLNGYPPGLPSREVQSGEATLKEVGFWGEYDEDQLIITLSQNSIGNAITELRGVVIKRVPDAEAYERFEPQLTQQLLEVRRCLI